MLLQPYGYPTSMTYVPAMTYVFVGLTSVVLAYFTAMDKSEDSEDLPKDESATAMLPGFGEAESTEEEEESSASQEEVAEPENEEQETENKEESEPPVVGGRKKRKTISKRKMKKSRSSKSRTK
jgi:hypothetical protein